MQLREKRNRSRESTLNRVSGKGQVLLFIEGGRGRMYYSIQYDYSL